MKPQEAVSGCDFWTTNVSETQALGSSTSPEIAHLFGCNVSTPRCIWSDPEGPRHYDIRVARFLRQRDQETHEMLVIDNPLYSMVVEEITRRQAAGLPG